MTLDDFSGPALPVTDDDLRAIAKLLSVSVAHVQAVREVESSGRGVHPETRRPTILFKPHVFHRETAGQFSASYPDISYAKWGERDYPPAQSQRYGQLLKAMTLAESAALRSASWGAFQVMGFNHRASGFATVQAFVAAMIEGERGQLRAFATFVLSNAPMLAALRAGDWGGFARLYNGKSYALHGYDQKLKAAFARHRGWA